MQGQKNKPKHVMRKMCPNFDREDTLETVLDVPIPEEMFAGLGNSVALRWQAMAGWMKAQTSDKLQSPIYASKYNEMSFLLYIVGSPLLPFQVQVDRFIQRAVKHSSIEASTAKYIVQQYIAATGGQPPLTALNSMCVIGQTKINSSEFHQGDENVKVRSKDEAGGFVIWQKNPDLWCLELQISGCKVIAGSNGKISWRQSSNQLRPICKGPPRPLRRFLQGLDPRATANLFIDAVCIGEKIINDEDCFILKLDTPQSTLEAQGGPKFEIIHHTIWGYFSQRSGLLVKFEDSRLLSVKTNKEDGDVFWETSSESVIEDYKYVDGINIAHGGKTLFTVFRYGEHSANHKRELQESWKIEEVDFNLQGLKPEFFMPPTEFHKK
ncbi:hypothetical protein Salat_2480600 [Sesamum alatum]|uniref:Uncharacterized protein n=1 Tax=Sesamum alatum TaxID=300844 RepID=A0AAE1XS56_9LAMI|nr:hypothetical protein Salat_2480600 [Sesamum alatum]